MVTRDRRISPKTHAAAPVIPLPGSLQVRWVRCGKAGCRCAQGHLHGPYGRRFWRENGRTRQQYVRKAEVERVQAGLQAWRAEHPPVAALRQRLTEIRRLMRLLGV